MDASNDNKRTETYVNPLDGLILQLQAQLGIVYLKQLNITSHHLFRMKAFDLSTSSDH